MSCTTTCKLCDRLIISDSVTIVGDSLVIDIPARAYNNGCRYCIVVAQTIPDAATINMPVAISIGGDTTTLYPLNRRCGAQAVAASMRTRTRYAVCVQTTAVGGSFRVLGDLPCAPDNSLPSLPVAAAAGGAGA